MKEQIKKLLGRGLPNAVVANAVGCTESYISQLLADLRFSSEVQAMRLAMLEKDAGRDVMLNSIEDQLAAKLEKAMPFIIKPQEITRTLQVVNGLKRRETGALQDAAQQSRIINVILPICITQKFTKNQHGEITEVDGRSLATLPLASLRTLVEARRSSLNVISQSKEPATDTATTPAAFAAEAA